MDCIKGELVKVKDKSLIEYVAQSIPNEIIKNEFLRNVHVTFTISGQEEEQPQLKKDDSVVVEKIKSYFDLSNTDIKKVANEFLATKKELGYLISAIKNDYKLSINNAKCFKPQIKTRYHNINQTFKNYGDEELEKLLKESQIGKFN